jgi:hypothetical protein
MQGSAYRYTDNHSLPHSALYSNSRSAGLIVLSACRSLTCPIVAHSNRATAERSKCCLANSTSISDWISNERHCLLRYDAVYSHESQLTFRRKTYRLNFLCLSSAFTLVSSINQSIRRALHSMKDPGLATDFDHSFLSKVRLLQPQISSTSRSLMTSPNHLFHVLPGFLLPPGYGSRIFLGTLSSINPIAKPNSVYSQ